MRALHRAGASFVAVAGACLALAGLAPAAGATAWQPVSASDVPRPMQVASVLLGSEVVVAWTTATGEVVATTFSTTPRVRVSGAPSAPIAPVGADGGPVLLAARGLGVSAAFVTYQNQDRSDPRNGIAIVSRSSDGSWRAPKVVPTGQTSSCGSLAGLLLPDGSPLFATNAADCQGVFLVHGSAFVGDADTIMYAPDNEALELALARDGRGNVWSAWYAPLQGVVMRQLDGTTGTPIGNEFVAPDSIPPASIWTATGDNHFALVCNPSAAGCRVIYKAHLGSRIVSWTPHDGGRRILVTADAGLALGSFAAAYRADGQLWLAWIANPNFTRQTLRFTLVGPAGRPAGVSHVPTPHGSVPTRLWLQPVAGGLLVLAGVPTTASSDPIDARQQLWADHVTKR